MWPRKPQCAILILAVALRAERLPVKTYTTADGLARDTVEAIVPDSRGFLVCEFLTMAVGIPN